MKKIISIAVLTAALALASCSDFLDQPKRGVENLETYFQTKEQCEKFLIGCYGAIFYDDWWQTGKLTQAIDMCTDDGWMGNTDQDATAHLPLAHYLASAPQSEDINDFYRFRYKGITRCNIAIDRIGSAPIDNEAKERMVAEAKFLRAYFYFEIIKNYGGAVKVMSFLTPSETEGATRSSVEESYSWVEQDLKDAAKVLPLRSELAAAEVGRATRGAAQGLLGKVYLYQAKWSDARTVLADLIGSNEYDLMPDFGQVWNVDYNNNQESLFEAQSMYDETYNYGSGYLTIITGIRSDPAKDADGNTWDGWAWCQPTSNLEKAFIDEGDDVRRKYTIIKHGDTEVAGMEAPLTDYLPDGKMVIDPAKHKSARVWRKNFIPYDKRPATWDKCKIPLNYRILRYADVLLMYAEACVESGEDLAKGEECLNRVRGRVGLGHKDLTRENVRKERRLELAGEQQRLYDIRRWDGASGKKVACELFGPNGSFVKYNTEESTDEFETTNLKEAQNKGYTFDEERDLLFPIPPMEISLSHGSIKQNPGYSNM